jgi:hypothetical protein
LHAVFVFFVITEWYVLVVPSGECCRLNLGQSRRQWTHSLHWSQARSLATLPMSCTVTPLQYHITYVTCSNISLMAYM